MGAKLGAEAVGLDVQDGRQGDVANAEVVRKAMEGCTGVMHAAALHAPHATHHHVSNFYDTNVTGTQNILDAAAAAGCDRIPVVHTSTTSMTITGRVKRA